MSKVSPSSVFLVSGGARGITAQCVIQVAQRYHCKFMLLGRSSISGAEPAWAQGKTDSAELKKQIMADFSARGEKFTPVAVQKTLDSLMARREIEDTMRQIQAVGGQAEYLSVDITDAAALKAQVNAAESRLGRVTGIIHGAGNLADKLIENKTERDFETVYAAKVQGLENMLAAVRPEGLDYLILFSSVAGFYGNIGQADYAIANEILNKTAFRFKQQYPNCQVRSINWGPWEAGMVTPELKQYFEQHGIRVIPIDTGAHMLVDELEGNGDIEVVVGDGIGILSAKVGSELKTHRLRRKLVLEDNPFLGDHVVNGKAVLPMVCAMSWMGNACEQLYPGYKLYGFDNYRVLKGIVFDETLADEYVLEVKEISKAEDGPLVFETMISSQTDNGKPRFHYNARLTLFKQLPERPVYPKMDLEARDNIPGMKYYEDKTLFHRYSFRGVERVLNISRDKVTMYCELPIVDERYQGQFPMQSFNYFSVDIGFQSMGIWVKNYYDAGSLPLQAQKGEYFVDVPPGAAFYVSLEIRSSSETRLVTDLYVHDEQGRVYMRVLGGEVTISKSLNDLFLLNTLPAAVK